MSGFRECAALWLSKTRYHLAGHRCGQAADYLVRIGGIRRPLDVCTRHWKQVRAELKRKKHPYRGRRV
ncbi:MAG: hypothetical protein ACRD3D_13100 [Terriglobia bacterium]